MSMKIMTIILFAVSIYTLQAQDGTKEYVTHTFDGTRIINGHSVETLGAGDLEFLISHRFGRLNGGLYEFLGLDHASIRFGFEYGITDRLNVGVGRSSYGKHFDAFAKAKLLQQRDGMPVTVTFLTSAAVNTLKTSAADLPLPLQSRFTYANQLLIARKFGEGFSLQLSPTHLHYNLVDNRDQPNDWFAVGAGARIQLTRMLGISLEYYHLLPGYFPADRKSPLGIGFDIRTAGHVFQLHFTNAAAMIEKGFIGETTGDWLKGDIQFGFNISRVFRLGNRR